MACEEINNFVNRLSIQEKPNAGRQARLEAAATEELGLLGVGSTARLGWGHSGGLLGGCPSPRDAVPPLVLPEAPATLLHPCPVSAYLSTSSAWKRMCGGILRPSCLAVLRLMTSSKRVGCSTGKSAGLAPLRILST
jgi:hypothetical protein